MTGGTILWWGRFDADYSRNRILRRHLAGLGWELIDFSPRLRPLATLESRFRLARIPALVWVPCFRQRDVAGAARWSRRHRVPLVFDPLISAYDKQVFERGKFPPDSRRARRLLHWEQRRFAMADRLLADTEEHARYFVGTLRVPWERVRVVPVGAEESLFFPGGVDAGLNGPPEVLFFGSFIALQGPEIIAEAARSYRGPAVRWRFIGHGPLLERCRQLAGSLTNVTFDPWVPYEELPAAIRRADILLGIFGSGAKAGRVIPNKVYQALACGRPVVTRSSPAYPKALAKGDETGLTWIEGGNPGALAEAIARLASDPARLPRLECQARLSYESYFSAAVVRRDLENALGSLISLPEAFVGSCRQPDSEGG
jgi:glycosyltransferase involved in cell wall biosynthesis